MNVSAWLKRGSLLALVLSACAGEVGVEEKLGADEQEIIGGTPVDPEGTGWIMVNGGCSGTLLRNDWILTAKHCSTVVGSSMVMGSQTRTVNRVVDHPTMDVTLARVSVPFTMNGSTTAHRRMLKRGLQAGIERGAQRVHGT